MRINYENSGRSSRYAKRQNGSGNNRRSSGRKSSGSSGGGGAGNVSSIVAKRNKYLEMAKEALSNGNRVEAENYYQHAEHYSKMLSAATAGRREREEASVDTGSAARRGNGVIKSEQQSDHNTHVAETNTDIKSEQPPA